ncbi:MAG: ATP-binding protein [Clostridia bacterium]|jgi:predicted AAA+ superfamily ATPase|nr:ATP-binding protein [Clostridia bacterium]
MGDVFINRSLVKTAREAFKYFPVLTITGPRQSGKTTMIKSEFTHLPYFSMEDIDIRRFAMNDPRGFLNQHPKGMILDEVQNTPELLSYIQGLVDEDSSKRYILSGSSQFSVIKQITQSLAGRTAMLELLPLSYQEIKSEADKKSLDNILYSGFYPAIYAGKNIPKLLYPSYTKTYLERDVRDLLNVKDIMLFQKFMRLCAGRIGSLFVASDLASELGVTVNTIKSWLSVLQASYIITMLPPWLENTTKRLVKTPKLYFCDTGLASYLLDIENEKLLMRDKMRGHLFENFIITEALKFRYNQGKESNLYFVRDSNGNEVDLILKHGDSFKCIEVKSSQTYNSEFEKGLKSVDSILGDRITDKAIIYAGDYENTEGKIKLINYKNISDWIFN